MTSVSLLESSVTDPQVTTKFKEDHAIAINRLSYTVAVWKRGLLRNNVQPRHVSIDEFDLPDYRTSQDVNHQGLKTHDPTEVEYSPECS